MAFHKKFQYENKPASNSLYPDVSRDMYSSATEPSMLYEKFPPWHKNRINSGFVQETRKTFNSWSSRSVSSVSENNSDPWSDGEDNRWNKERISNVDGTHWPRQKSENLSNYHLGSNEPSRSQEPLKWYNDSRISQGSDPRSSVCTNRPYENTRDWDGSPRASDFIDGPRESQSWQSGSGGSSVMDYSSDVPNNWDRGSADPVKMTRSVKYQQNWDSCSRDIMEQEWELRSRRQYDSSRSDMLISQRGSQGSYPRSSGFISRAYENKRDWYGGSRASCFIDRPSKSRRCSGNRSRGSSITDNYRDVPKKGAIESRRDQWKKRAVSATRHMVTRKRITSIEEVERMTKNEVYFFKFAGMSKKRLKKKVQEGADYVQAKKEIIKINFLHSLGSGVQRPELVEDMIPGGKTDLKLKQGSGKASSEALSEIKVELLEEEMKKESGSTSTKCGATETSPSVKKIKRSQPEEKSTFSKTLTSIKLAVIPQGYPESKLTWEQGDHLIQALMGRLIGITNDAPSFAKVAVENGALILVTSEQLGEPWVREAISKLEIGVALEVGLARELLQVHKVIMRVSNFPKVLTGQEVLHLLTTQNRDIYARDWKIVRQIDGEDCTGWIFALGDDSFAILRAKGFRLSLAFSRVSFRLLERDDHT